MESFGRLEEEGYKCVDELGHAAGGRDGGSMAKKGVCLQGTTSSGHSRAYTGGHTEESSAVHAGTTRKPRSGAENNSINIEHIDTNGLGMDAVSTHSRTSYVFECWRSGSTASKLGLRLRYHEWETGFLKMKERG